MKNELDIAANKYTLSVLLISVAVAILIHFPELISLFHTHERHWQLFPGIRLSQVASEVIYAFIALLLLFAVNTAVFHFNQGSIRISWKKAILSFVMTLALSKLLNKGFFLLHNELGLPVVRSMVHYYLHPFRDIVIACVVTGSCYIIHLIYQRQQVIYENQQLRAENILSQYEVLKNQLNPHMLFNSLNTLQSLVRESPEKAREYIGELSRVLRYTLRSNERQCVSLSDEMQFVEAYIFLLKMRYEDNLHFEITLDKTLEQYCLPPMSIQILIENAVKHNEISSRKPLTIRIFTDPEPCVSVSNPLQPKLTPPSGTGIGLANLAKRYHFLYRKEIQVTKENDFTVRIPLIPDTI